MEIAVLETLCALEDGAPPVKRAPTIRLGAGFQWNLQALTQAANAVETGGKSPVSALNELGVRVAYSVLRQGGPAHCPSFTVAVTVADMTFEGWGHSKREARAAAAKACLAALLARAGRVLPHAAPHDFTSDEPRGPTSDFQCLEAQAKQEVEVDMKPPATPPAPPAPTAATALFGASGASAHKSPINSLYETCPGLSFHCTFGDGSSLEQPQAPVQLSHSMRFKVVCQIKDQTFEGYGSSKKLAKLAAARAALAVLDEGKAPAACAAPPGCLPQPRADTISKLVNEKFHEIMKGDLVHSKRKVLAGIVLTIDGKPDASKVIAVTTGTKCVSGEHMSVRGRAVNDCHAEVAARRCLQRHLYAQLLMYAEAKDPTKVIPQSDLEPVPGGGYQMKSDRQLHLYVSTAPCGDGRIFSPHEQPDPTPDRHPNRLARGQLRTKIESGEGTIPVKNCSNIIQTWDGVMQGERLLTMSCSDKVCRWCVVGLQGALLSRLLRPVYLHSLVLGSLLHPHHMYRAICGRIENQLQSLPPPFRLQRPLLARAASTEARTPARAPSFSVCWCHTSPLPEVVNATTGKLESGQPSLLCKQSMFARWQHLVKRLPLLPQDPNGVDPTPLPANVDQLLYNEAKMLCPAYQVAKERLIEAFDKAKLGRWIKKPIEQDQFVCEIVDAAPAALFAWAGPAPNCDAAQRAAEDQLREGRANDWGIGGKEEDDEGNDCGNSGDYVRERNDWGINVKEENNAIGEGNDCCNIGVLKVIEENDAIGEGNDYRYSGVNKVKEEHCNWIEEGNRDSGEIEESYDSIGERNYWDDEVNEVREANDGFRGKVINNQYGELNDCGIRGMSDLFNNGGNLAREDYSPIRKENYVVKVGTNHARDRNCGNDERNVCDNRGVNRGMEENSGLRDRNNYLSRERNGDYRNFCINVQISVGQKRIGASENKFNEAMYGGREMNRSRNHKYDPRVDSYNTKNDYWKFGAYDTSTENENDWSDAYRVRNVQNNSGYHNMDVGFRDTIRDVREVNSNETPFNDRDRIASLDNNKIIDSNIRRSTLLAKRAAYNSGKNVTVTSLRQPRLNDASNENYVDGASNGHYSRQKNVTVVKLRQPKLHDDVHYESDGAGGANHYSENSVTIGKLRQPRLNKNDNANFANYDTHHNVLKEKEPNSNKFIAIKSNTDNAFKSKAGNLQNVSENDTNMLIAKLKNLRISNKENEARDASWLELRSGTKNATEIVREENDLTQNENCRQNENDCGENQQFESHHLRRLLLLMHRGKK